MLGVVHHPADRVGDDIAEVVLRREWQGYKEKTIVHPHFGGSSEVFAIDVSDNLRGDF